MVKETSHCPKKLEGGLATVSVNERVGGYRLQIQHSPDQDKLVTENEWTNAVYLIFASEKLPKKKKNLYCRVAEFLPLLLQLKR